jgi:hypothetical protein
VVEASPAAAVRLGRPVGPPWSTLAAQAARAVKRVLWDRLPDAVAQSEEQPVVAPSVPREPRIEAVQAAPEP